MNVSLYRKKAVYIPLSEMYVFLLDGSLCTHAVCFSFHFFFMKTHAIRLLPFALLPLVIFTPALAEEHNSSVEKCASLRGLERSLCREEQIILDAGEELPTCEPAERNVGHRRVYCMIKGNLARHTEVKDYSGRRTHQRAQRAATRRKVRQQRARVHEQLESNERQRVIDPGDSVQMRGTSAQRRHFLQWRIERRGRSTDTGLDRLEILNTSSPVARPRHTVIQRQRRRTERDASRSRPTRMHNNIRYRSNSAGSQDVLLPRYPQRNSSPDWYYRR